MIYLARNLPRDFRGWDRLTRIVFIIAAGLLLLAAVLFFTAPDSIRTNVLFGMGALIIVLQMTILYGNRGMRSAFARAQQLYIEGDFESARQLLETTRAQGSASFRTLTLLGNTYRQLADLDRSAQVLSEALHKAPTHHFPLYGFGRTLLAQGEFDRACAMLRRAIDAGAPPVVMADLGEAHFMNDEPEEAQRALAAASEQEGVRSVAHRALMTGYLLHLLGQGAMPDADTVRDGLPYWIASAERYHATPYGARLHQLIAPLAAQS